MNKLKTIIKFIIPLLPLIAATYPIFKGDTNLVHDTYQAYLFFHYNAKGLIQGIVPYWNPYMHAGEPSFAYGFWSSILIPTLPAIYLLSFITKNILALFYVNVFLLIFIFALGGYFLSRLALTNERSSFLVYIILLYSGVPLMWLHQIYHLMIIYMVPWVIFFLVKWIKTERSGFLILTAVSAGAAFSAHYFLYAATASLIFLFFYLVFTRDFSLFRALWKGKLKFVAALALFAVLLLPVLNIFASINSEFVSPARENVQSIDTTLEVAGSHGAGKPEALLWSVYPDPTDIWKFKGLYPFKDLPHEITPWEIEQMCFIGIAGLMLMLIGVAHSQNRLKWPLLLTLASVILVFLGYNSFLHGLFFYTLPLFNKIRNLEFLTGPIVLISALLAGMGADLLFKANRRARKTAKALVAVLFLTVTALFAYPFIADKQQALVFLDASGSVYAHSVIFLGLFLFSLRRLSSEAGKRNFFIVMMVVIIYNGLLLYNYTLSPRSFYYNTVKPESQPSTAPYRFGFEETRVPLDKRVTLFHYWNYEPLASERMTYIVEDKTQVWGVLKEFYRYASFIDMYPHLEIKARLRLFDAVASSGMEDPQVAGFAAVVEDPKFYEGGPRRAEALGNSGIRLVKLNEIRPAVDLTAQDIRIVRFDPNNFIFDINLPEPKFLVYYDNYYEGWNASIDGKQTDIYKAFGSFKGLMLEKGAHRVSFSFTPAFSYLFWMYYVLVFGGVLASAALLLMDSASQKASPLRKR